jgi:hypothetical protein
MTQLSITRRYSEKPILNRVGNQNLIIMPTVNITNANIYNAAVNVTGVLTGSPGIPITAYTVEVIPRSGDSIRIATNVQSSGGNFTFCGIAPNNTPFPDNSSIRVITNRQAQDEKTAEQPSNPTIGFLPLGSYQLSCRDITVTLECEAQKIDGTWVASTLDITTQVRPNVVNNDGTLELITGCETQNGFQPGGSWSVTSRAVSVTLRCEARKIDGSWVSASFDLTTLSTATLSNNDGVLVAS